MKKRLLALLLATAMVLSLAACGSSSDDTATEDTATEDTSEDVAADTTEETEEEEVELIEINVAYMPNYSSMITFAGAELSGAFEEYGFDVTFYEFVDGPTIVAAMESGSIDYAYIGSGAHHLAINGSVEIICMSQVSDADEVIANASSGIETAADLEGKKVGYASGTSSEAILNFVLASAGLTMDDIEAYEMDQSGITTAMLSGSLDACATWSPATFTVKDGLGDDAVSLGSNADFTDQDASLSSFIVTPSYAEENYDEMVNFVKALYAGMDYRSDESNLETISEWIAALTGLDYETVHQQRADGLWIDSADLYELLENGEFDAMYQMQQDSFITAGNVEDTVELDTYIRYDVMYEAFE